MITKSIAHSISDSLRMYSMIKTCFHLQTCKFHGFAYGGLQAGLEKVGGIGEALADDAGEAPGQH